VRAVRVFNEYLTFGGMPAISDERIDDDDKHDWLKNYCRTYLQRDLADLANLRDLDPFITAQKAASELTSQTLNFSSLARICGISSLTAKRFINYLEISYQVFLLKPWVKNAKKRLVKSPKLHFIDPGIQRSVISRRGSLTGGEFESAVVAEIYKQVNNAWYNVDFFYLRTQDGREVDLILELENGIIPIEIKKTQNVSKRDAKHLHIDDIVKKPIIHSFVLSMDNQVKRIDEKITALPVAWFLS
jgi:hypothetical protein